MLDPHQLHQVILEAHRRAEARLLILGARLKVMHDTEVYRDLGYDGLTEYVAQPELRMRKSWAYALIQAAELVQAMGLTPREVSGVEVTKLAMASCEALKALEVGDRNAAVAPVRGGEGLGLQRPPSEATRGWREHRQLDEECRRIQKTLVETLLARMIEAMKYDGYTSRF